MQKTKIEWCDRSWNPITGCNNGCSFCYARKIALRFTGHFNPTFHPERLGQPLKLKKSSRIFADSMSDFWSKGVKQYWRNRIWCIMKNTPQHTYFVLTKKPEKITKKDRMLIPNNCWIGVSVCDFGDRQRIMRLVNKAPDRRNLFVSVEPILNDLISNYIYVVDWIILGGLTGKRNPFRPHESVIDEIVDTARHLRKPLFIKDNLGYRFKIQEFPKLKEVCSEDIRNSLP